MKLEDLQKLSEFFKKLISDAFFQGQSPNWLSALFIAALIVAFVLLAVWGFLFIVGQISKIWGEQIRPIYYNQEEKKLLLKRQRFAEHIELEIRKLNNREEWKDYRFTELEAEVEAEGRQRKSSIIPFLQSTRRGLRREQSLSKALKLSSERLILVEGEPGAGKSIALRHVTEKLAQHATRNKSIKSIIPVYINLKKLERPSQDKIDINLIKSFVKQELNRVGDRDVEQFLDDDFQREVKEGTLLFLFDSFDEIPDVLSSVEADQTIRDYAEAIDNFLSGFNKCRGIIASRQFRGPKHLGWPHFRILPLENRRWELIRRAELEPRIEQEITRRLRIAPQEIQDMSKNPMFLGILCDDMKNGSPFPENTHSVFESYLEKRITRDKDRLERRFRLSPAEVRNAAEKVAFCMSIDQSLGLSPTRKDIQNAMERNNLRVKGGLEQNLNALEYLKLARSEDEIVAGGSQLFTFSHRRFQEYFATCVVLSDLNRINPRQLLTDGRWRETAVVIFQTQPPEVFAPLLVEAKFLLDEIIGNLTGLIDDPIGYVANETDSQKRPIPKPFVWPIGLLALLGLLQDGFISRIKDLSDEIQLQVGRLLLTASIEGTLADRKWSLEVAGIVPQPVLLWLLRNAFSSKSQWLKEVAYRQTARLSKIPDDIAASIRKALLELFYSNRLNKELFATNAHLSRLDQSSQYINILRLLQWIKPIDIILITSGIFLLFLVLFIFKGSLIFANIFNIIILLFLLIASFIFLGKSFLSFVFFRFLVGFFSIPTIGFYSLLSFSPLFWYLFAISASYTGKFTHPFWWSFFFLFPVLFIVAKSIPKDYLLVGFSFFAILSIIGGTLYLFIPWIAQILGYDLFFWITNALGILAIFIQLLFMRSTTTLSDWIEDWFRFKKWIKLRPSLITTQDLLNLITPYHRSDFCKRLIITIRERNSILITDDSEQLINELALCLESHLILKKNIDNYSGSEFFNTWLKQYTLKDKSRFVKLGSEFLDEVYILLEHIRARRQNSSI